LFAANDARMLLLGLRFDSFLPIDHGSDRMKGIGESIQTPRLLNAADVKLLEVFGAEADRWSVFISYRRTPVDVKLASRLSTALQSTGLCVFRDQEALRPGLKWWPTLQRAIARSRHFVLLIGASTHESPWVRREVQYAIEKGVKIIPVVTDGAIGAWSDFGLHEVHAVFHKRGEWPKFVGEFLRSSPLQPLSADP
jgi:hypothetical protein